MGKLHDLGLQMSFVCFIKFLFVAAFLVRAGFNWFEGLMGGVGFFFGLVV